jgi:DNA-binding transcriptional MerR regulator
MNQAAAAAYLGFTPRQLRRWIELGKLPIPIVQFNGRNYFEPEELDRFKASLPRTVPNGGI